ncbi:hypothetical protein K170097C1_32300 [Hungatella effluvii]
MLFCPFSFYYGAVILIVASVFYTSTPFKKNYKISRIGAVSSRAAAAGWAMVSDELWVTIHSKSTSKHRMRSFTNFVFMIQ